MNKGAILGFLILGGIIGLAIFAMVNVPRSDSSRSSETSMGMAAPVMAPPALADLSDGRSDFNAEAVAYTQAMG